MKRFLRFRLRTLLLALVCLSLPLGWFARQLHTKRLERAAVAELRADGIAVLYEHQVDAQHLPVFFAANTTLGPGWLQHVMGPDWYSDVTAIHGGYRTKSLQEEGPVVPYREDTIFAMHASVRPANGESVVDRLHLFPKLRRLHLEWTDLSPEDLKTIARQKSLRYLYVPRSIKPRDIEALRAALPDCEIMQPELFEDLFPEREWEKIKIEKPNRKSLNGLQIAKEQS